MALPVHISSMRGVHKVSFSLVHIYCVKRLRVRDRVVMSHDACTSGTSRVLTVASLQRLKMAALIPALADSEVQSVIKFLNTQSIAPIEIHLQLCQVYTVDLTSWASRWCVAGADNMCMMMSAVRGRPSLRQPCGACAGSSRPVISITSHTSKNSCPVSAIVSEWGKGGDECHKVVPIPGNRFLQHRDTKVGPIVSIPEVNM